MKRFSVLLAGLFLASGAWAAAADQVSAADAYVRLAPPNAPATGAFMVLKNSGDKDVKLVKADNPLSKSTELHQHSNDNGVMKMRPVAAIDIKAKGEAVLKPGGLHVMLIGMQKPLKEGDAVLLTLTFDDGSSKKIEAPVRAQSMEMPAHGHHHHH